jgi:hypothetical protein
MTLESSISSETTSRPGNQAARAFALSRQSRSRKNHLARNAIRDS